MSVSDNRYLAHYGIKGQSWGIRRFQNEDGTLTEEGKARYNKLSDYDRNRYEIMKESAQGVESTIQKQKQALKKNPWYLKRVLLEGAIKVNIADLKELHNVMNSILEKVGNVPVKKTLSNRFDSALKDNPKLTYKTIYKEMGVNMNSDDPDVYKEAEEKWFKKHGY